MCKRLTMHVTTWANVRFVVVFFMLIVGINQFVRYLAKADAVGSRCGGKCFIVGRPIHKVKYCTCPSFFFADIVKHQAVFWHSLGKITKFFKPKSRSPHKGPVEVESSCLSSDAALSVLTEDSVSSTSVSDFDFDDDCTALSSDLDPGWLLCV